MSDVATGDEEAEEVEQKVLIPEFYKKDYSLFREELNKLLELETARLDLARIPSADGQRVRIKFKNLLIEHANSTLRTYRKSIAYVNADHLASQKDEAHLLPPNKALRQRNDLLRTVFIKAVQFNSKAQVQQLDFDFQELKHPQEKLYVERNGQTVPLEQVLPTLPIQDYERRLKNIREMEVHLQSLYDSCGERIQRSKVKVSSAKSSDSKEESIKRQTSHFHDLSFN